MDMTASRYQQQLIALLPPGAAWPKGPASQLGQLLLALGAEPARVDNRAGDILTEANPLTTAELLEQWEGVFGLPDSCTGELDSLVERRNALLANVTHVGGQCPAYFIAVAEKLGYTITITEFTPFRAGVNAAGDNINGDAWAFAWQVNAPETTVFCFAAGQSWVGDPLRTWGNAVLECLLTQLCPAHTIVIFAYGG